MKLLLLIPLLFTTGCVGVIKELKKPPFPYAVTHHTRFTGLKAIYQGQGIWFGWGSDVWTAVPVSNSRLYAPPISDTFRLGQGLNPFNTQITEDMVWGWEGVPPPPRLKFDK